MTIAAQFRKDPDAVLDYVWDWSAWLDGDIIASYTVISEAGIVVELAMSSHTDSTVTIWLSGGTVGVEYDVTVRIVTAAGRTDDRTLSFLINHK